VIEKEKERKEERNRHRERERQIRSDALVNRNLDVCITLAISSYRDICKERKR
jgi:hypothetical protein